MLFKVTFLPDDLGAVDRNWVERFVVFLDEFVFEQVFDEHVLFWVNLKYCMRFVIRSAFAF